MYKGASSGTWFTDLLSFVYAKELYRMIVKKVCILSSLGSGILVFEIAVIRVAFDPKDGMCHHM